MASKEQAYHRELRRLSDYVKDFLVLLDYTMKQPESVDRGRRVADLANKLEMKNDIVRRFTLEINRDGKKLRRPQPRSAQSA